MIAYLKSLLEKDLEELKGEEQVSLLAKWLPSINASSHLTIARAKKFIKAFGLSEAAYRKALTALRARIELIENKLRTKDYTFDYGKQPSRAMFKYRQAFTRNDQERYLAFLDNVKKGEAKLHTDNLAPYELIEPYLRDYNPQFSYHQLDERLPGIDASKLDAHVLNVTWEALPDYGLNENVLPIIDTSGSMYMFSSPIPAAVALSLGLYMAEHNKGIFKNHFIQFSEKPELIEIKGSTFTERLRYITTFAAFANTDIEAVFDLILNTAIKNNVPQKELPSKLINVSDMEFDQATENRDMTNFENPKIKFSAHNYKLPEIIFWNDASRNRQQPVTMNEQGVALVSGVTPRIFAMVAGANFSPYTFMMEVLENERYACITA